MQSCPVSLTEHYFSSRTPSELDFYHNCLQLFVSSSWDSAASHVYVGFVHKEWGWRSTELAEGIAEGGSLRMMIVLFWLKWEKQEALTQTVKVIACRQRPFFWLSVKWMLKYTPLSMVNILMKNMLNIYNYVTQLSTLIMLDIT